nr:hypothetical protein [Pantoea coffeiphila]
MTTEQLKPAIKEGSAEIIRVVTGLTVGAVTGYKVQDKFDNTGKKWGRLILRIWLN